MAREIFQDTMSQADPDDGILRALAGIEITVYPGGTVVGGTPSDDPVPIYQSRTGGAQGPAPEAAASGGPNPFVTGITGAVEFWLDAGFYDINIRDSQVPARIPTRVLQWNAVAAVEGGIPGSWIGRPGGDTGVDIEALGDSVLRQSVQIGQVIQWWRPDSSVPLPEGFEPADGATISVDQHDFPVAGPITLPNLRNKFVLGADHTKADATAAVNGDGSANAPGIRGAGGSQTHTLTHDQSGVNGNGSTTNSGVHSHQVQAVGVNPGGGGLTWTTGNELASFFQSTDTFSNPSAHSHPLTARGADAAHNNTPAYIGLLMLIKVRRA